MVMRGGVACLPCLKGARTDDTSDYVAVFDAGKIERPVLRSVAEADEPDGSMLFLFVRVLKKRRSVGVRP
jgi:hypothetical protein